jgi:hypothetical protein
LLRDYYRPFQVWLQEAAGVRKIMIKRRSYRAVALEEFDLSVGLSSEVVEQIPDVKHRREHHSHEDHEFIGADGVFIGLGSIWSPVKMRLEPQERHRS